MQLEAFCGYPFNRVRVTCEGNVAMCCFQRSDAASRNPYLGNLLKQPFDDIWFGELADEVRTTTLEGNLHSICQVAGCPFHFVRKKRSVTYNEYPNFLEIDLPNTHCNVGFERPNEQHPACIMCERASKLFKPETNHLPEVLSKLKYLLPNLRYIHIQGIAEPFYKDLIFQVLDQLNFDEYREQITVSTTTNGTLLGLAKRKLFLQRVPKSVTVFSLDAATPETFQRIRILPAFHQVLENLYAFGRERMRNRQYLRINNNINLLNVDEILGMVQIAHQARVDGLEFNPTDGCRADILVNATNCGRFRKAQQEATAECERLKVPFEFVRPLDLGFSEYLFTL